MVSSIELTILTTYGIKKGSDQFYKNRDSDIRKSRKRKEALMKKLTRKLVVLAMAALLAMVMAVPAFAAAPSGSYTTTLYGPNHTTLPHDNPIKGAIVTYDGEDTTIMLYLEPITVYGVTGVVTSLTLTGQSDSRVLTTDKSGTVTYPTSIQYEFSGQITVPATFDISYTVEGLSESFTHPTTGTLVINDTTNP